MRAKAFSPAHITGFFKAELEDNEPNQLGSIGAGFSIQKGVRTTVNVRSKTKHDIINYEITILFYHWIIMIKYFFNMFCVIFE